MGVARKRLTTIRRKPSRAPLPRTALRSLAHVVRSRAYGFGVRVARSPVQSTRNRTPPRPSPADSLPPSRSVAHPSHAAGRARERGQRVPAGNSVSIVAPLFDGVAVSITLTLRSTAPRILYSSQSGSPRDCLFRLKRLSTSLWVSHRRASTGESGRLSPGRATPRA